MRIEGKKREKDIINTRKRRKDLERDKILRDEI